MSIINSIFSKYGNNVIEGCSKIVKEETPVYRFGGFEQLGAQVRPKDTRTPSQLCATINALAEKNPAVKEFVKDLKSMNPKHLGLVSDTIELASRKEMLITDVNMNKVIPQTGKSLLQHLLSVYPKASKENPHAMEFAQEVINNTDTLTSKYFLAVLNGIFTTPQAGKHLEALKPMVKPLAEATINGAYLGTFEKQMNFINLINGILTPQTKPEKIALMPKLCQAVDRVPEGNFEIVLNKFAMSDTPLKQVEQNIAILPEVAHESVKQGKSIDVVDFVNSNVNFAKANQNNVNIGNVKPVL